MAKSKTGWTWRVTAFLSIAAVLSIATVSAQAATSSPDEWEEARSWLLDRGVEPAVVETLIEKVAAGVAIDSMGADAIPTETVTKTITGVQETVSVFSDGSISISAIEVPVPTPVGTVTTFAVGACAGSSSGSTWVSYRDCKVTESNGFLEVNFRASYTRATGGASIDGVSSPYAYAIGGTALTPTLSITKSNWNSSGPARAQAVTQYSSTASTFTAYLYLNVTPSSAYSSKSGF